MRPKCFQSIILALLSAYFGAQTEGKSASEDSIASPASSPVLIRPVRTGTTSHRIDHDRQGVIRLCQVEYDPQLAFRQSPGARFGIRLFDDISFELIVDRIEQENEDAVMIVGHLAGATGSRALLISEGNRLTGSIRAGQQGMFDFRTDSQRRHWARELDIARLETCGWELARPVQSGTSPLPEVESIPEHSPTEPAQVKPAARHETVTLIPSTQRGTPPPNGCDDGTVIDLMVVYTADARIAANGGDPKDPDPIAIHDLIDLSVLNTNLAFQNSLIATSINLVHRQEVAYTETGNSAVDLAALHDPADGVLDEVHALRDQFSADIVALWVDNLDFGGRVLAPPNPNGKGGFQIMRQDNGALNTMAHELGHNLGCAHDRVNNGTADVYLDDAYGYIEPGLTFMTIMAVVPPFGVPYIEHFSNPNVLFAGLPTGIAGGDPDGADCARVINLTRHMIANYRLSPVAGLPPVLFVDASKPGGGDGLSWSTAYNDLQDAICQARRSPGDVQEIWVAGGTYSPDLGTGLRQFSFFLQNGLAIYGGFAGTESSRAGTRSRGTVSMLSGDIGISADPTDNTQHVVIAEDVDETALLDGFMVSGGQADVQNLFFNDTGAGMRIDAASPTVNGCTFDSNAATSGAGMGIYGLSQPQINNCVFINNQSTYLGGGVDCLASVPSFFNCRFENNGAQLGGGAYCFSCASAYDQCTFGPDNSAIFGGGGLYNDSSTAQLDLCTFDSNLADWGAGMASVATVANVITCEFNFNTAGFAAGGVDHAAGSGGTFLDCTFLMNSADSAGGLHNDNASPNVWACRFESNVAIDGGGGLQNEADSSPDVWNCDFILNEAYYGGGMSNLDGCNPTVASCRFTDNTVGFGGAGVTNSACVPTYDFCVFTGNQAVSLEKALTYGGAMYNDAGAVPTVRDSQFRTNQAGYAGGAVCNFASGARFARCLFADNQADFGGAAHNGADSPGHYVSCAFVGNDAEFSGGGMDNSQSSSDLTNCFFSGNRAVNWYGGAMTNFGGSNTTLTNCTLSLNQAGIFGGGIATDTNGPTAQNSILWGNTVGARASEGEQLHVFSGAPSLDYCRVEGWTGALGGSGNSGDDPVLSDPDGTDDLTGTDDDDARLSPASPAIDAGNNLAVVQDMLDLDADLDINERVPHDLYGNSRFVDDPATIDSGISDPPDDPGVVDVGAVEFQPPPSCSCGDLDGNAVVDLNDFLTFITCFDLGSPFGGCNADALFCSDMNGSGDVDLNDVLIFTQHFGTAPTNSPPNCL